METNKTGYERALELIAECKRTKSTTLDLGNLGLTEVPEELWECVWLERLSLGFPIIHEISWINTNKLASNQLTTIAPNLNLLINLKVLFFDGNNIKKIENLDKLNNLKILRFSRNQVQKIENLDKLQNLDELYLGQNKIQKIENLKNLINLKTLSLHSNEIQKIENLDKLQNLDELYLGQNKIRKIENLSKLKLLKLFLFSNQIQRIENLDKLENLNRLNLGRNQIRKIENLDKLENLNHLGLDENQIEKIENLDYLKKLNHLNLGRNQIRKIENLDKLENLNRLSFYDNQIRKIENLNKLFNLNEIFLGQNQIQKIENLFNLSKLTSINLTFNQIQILPKKILYKPYLENLELNNNPINHIPKEILKGILCRNASNKTYYDNALPDLHQWYADLEKGSIPNYYFKLLILGNGRVGKSCIVDALQGRKFDSNKKSSHAIILEKWSPQNYREPPIPNYFIWDFGGQEIYHSTHRWFMQSRAVYMVVWDRNSEALSRIYDEKSQQEYDNHSLPYWINTIRSNNPDIPILLVENKIDKFNNQPKFLSESELPSKYRQQIQQTFFSAKESQRYLPMLLPYIQQITQSMDEWGQEMPLSWHKVRERILDCIFTADGKATLQKLSKTEFEVWCTEAKVFPKSIPSLLRFLYRTGIVYTNENLLGDTIILDQQWAIEAVYKVLDRESDFFIDTLEKKGRFPQRWLFREWGNEYVNEDKHLFLQFMKSCKLCFQIKHKDEGKHTQYVIPQLMPETPPANVTAIWQADLPNVYYLEFQYDFLHYATVQDFIVEMGRKTNLEFIWKNGISIPHQESQALVTAAVPDKIIHIRTMGAHRAFLLSAIQNAFLSQIDKDLAPTVRVSNDGLHFVELAELQKCQAADNTNVEVVHQASLAKSYQAAALYAWALQRDDKADLQQLPDVVQISTPVVAEKTAPSPTPPSNPFIASPNVTDKGDTIKIELPKSMFTIQTPQLDNIEKVVTQSYEINKAHFALSQRSRDYIESIFERVKIADAQLFDSALKQREFYKKADAYFQQLPPAEQQAFPDGWQNAPAKDKLKVVLSLGFIKYERELEVKGFALPRTWEAFKGVFVNEEG